MKFGWNSKSYERIGFVFVAHVSTLYFQSVLTLQSKIFILWGEHLRKLFFSLDTRMDKRSAGEFIFQSVCF